MAANRLRALRDRATGSVRRRLRVDTRSLAALRIGLGALVVADLLLRARNLTAFYTDAGAIPREALLEYGNPLHLSVHAVSGDAWFQAALFLVHGAVALSLLVGYRTTLATVGTWVLVLSLHNRAPVVLNGGDYLLRLVLFWAMFVPLGERWSVDAVRRDDHRETVVSVGTTALLAQVLIMYAVTAGLKLDGTQWVDGTAMAHVLSLEQFTVFLGDVLDPGFVLLPAVTYLWLAAITLSPLLVVLTGPRRTAFVALLAGTHLGMLAVLRIDLFPLVSVAALFAFLPGWFWDRAEGSLADAHPVAAARRGRDRLAASLPAVSVSNVPPALSRWRRRLGAALPAAFLVLVVLFNLGFLGYPVDAGPADPAVDLTRTDQYWNMFAPDPAGVDAWIVAPATLANGSRVDAFHDRAVRWEKPPDVSASYPTARWRKYLVNLWDGWWGYREYFGAYLCRTYNATHATGIERVSVYAVEQPTRIGNATEPTGRERLVDHECRPGA